ncbi:MAG: HAMP domain-containing histidine kinase [Acidimicrobiia bacterium]|nr:HAMP domain-containing histidine kinase [Acidimicrobiia bacterium]
MRRQLITVFVAISVMVAVAFVVPLGFLVRTTAEDRAIDAARSDAAAIVPALVSGSTRGQIESAAGATPSGREGRLTVMTSTGWTIGPVVEMSERFEAALSRGVSAIGSVDGGVEVVTAVASGPGELSAIRVYVPDADLRRGQWTAWVALAGVAVALVGLSVLVADRLARSFVRPAQELAAAAHRLGDGDLSTRVDPDGPPELVELSGTFNSLGSQVSSMLARERELVAELSHRLRTPLTKLRMRVDQVADDALAEELRSDVANVTQVVNDLIAEARSSLRGVSESCDAASVVTERVEFWSVLAEDTERPWSFDRGRAPLMVPVSSASLGAVVDVLIENVFAHTDDAVRFTVGFEERNGEVRIWVDDAGSGFDEAALTRGVSRSGSTGLGLDIARSTAEAAGGSLHIGESALGGSEVAITLPRISTGSS